MILCVATAVTLTAVFRTTNWKFSHTSMPYICRIVYLYKHLLYFISENCNFPSPFRLPMRIEYAFDIEGSSEAHTSRISNKIHDHIISGNRRYLLAILAKQRTTLAAVIWNTIQKAHTATRSTTTNNCFTWGNFNYENFQHNIDIRLAINVCIAHCCPIVFPFPSALPNCLCRTNEQTNEFSWHLFIVSVSTRAEFIAQIIE